jgi:hypothetical protein
MAVVEDAVAVARQKASVTRSTTRLRLENVNSPWASNVPAAPASNATHCPNGRWRGRCFAPAAEAGEISSARSTIASDTVPSLPERGGCVPVNAKSPTGMLPPQPPPVKELRRGGRYRSARRSSRAMTTRWIWFVPS